MTGCGDRRQAAAPLSEGRASLTYERGSTFVALARARCQQSFLAVIYEAKKIRQFREARIAPTGDVTALHIVRYATKGIFSTCR